MTPSATVQTFLAVLALACGFAAPVFAAEDHKPTLFIIGDSTVNNSGKGMQGWGTPIASLCDPAKLDVQNKARGGRSSRTYYTEGLWDDVAKQLKPGDFVLMQFGHNDGGNVANDPKGRASLKGTGEETQEVVLDEKAGGNGKKQTVHSYGWYLRKFIEDSKMHGATPIVLSPVPRDMWKECKVLRASNDYGKWAGEVAKAQGVPFIDLNEIIAAKYEKLGQEKVTADYFTTVDHTHTSPAGARVNAESVVEGIRGLSDCPLKELLK
jgi:lysophospholipase L1-like esterase